MDMPMKKYMHDFRVIRNRRISEDYFVLELLCPVNLPEIFPGQFVQVLVENSAQTYLRRPISIYDVCHADNSLSLLIKACGNGTRKLYQLEENQLLNLIYPLGNSFGMIENSKVLLIGGGVGIAPMLLLAKQLKDKGNIVDVLIGGRTSADILEPRLYEPYANVYVTTDDGSLGEKGMVTQHSIFRNGLEKYARIHACGPDPMMKAVSVLASRLNIPCEVSLENLMACGIGACLCCIVETTSGNLTSCVDGPVFDTRKLVGWTDTGLK
jgi:dihydroorotate dehydrogenase electron transfer subunit